MVTQNQTTDLRRSVDEIRAELDAMEQFVAQGRTRLEVLLKESTGAADMVQLRAFIKKPWCVLPKSASEYWLVVPIWSDVHAGWLHSSTESHRIFIVDRYSQWFGAIPAPLREELKLEEPIQADVRDGILKTTQGVADKIKAHLGQTIKKGEQWKVKGGHEFSLLADLIEMGAMPFAPQPVEVSDLRAWRDLSGPLHALRGYQNDAWQEFLAHGAVGVYWPMSTGKTVIGAYVFARIKGPKLLVVPSRTLMEQWSNRIRTWAGQRLLDEIDLITYASYKKVANKKYVVSVFDECHRLPANTFSRFATVETKYRLGLSATPFREDGRTSYVIALTGRPVGVDWDRFIRDGLIREPDIRVRILKNQKKKVEAAVVEARSGAGRKLVFADSIEIGRSLARKLDCPFIYGDTRERLKILEENQLCVVSRVGDEGVSLPDLAKVIELDFHGGSRRQEMQRVGRLFHSQRKERGDHVVLMTPEEHARYGRRFLALEEKGLKVKVHDES